jgi:hypothetical protein
MLSSCFLHYYCNYSYHKLYTRNISYDNFYYDNYNLRIKIEFDSYQVLRSSQAGFAMASNYDLFSIINNNVTIKFNFSP